MALMAAGASFISPGALSSPLSRSISRPPELPPSPYLSSLSLLALSLLRPRSPEPCHLAGALPVPAAPVVRIPSRTTRALGRTRARLARSPPPPRRAPPYSQALAQGRIRPFCVLAPQFSRNYSCIFCSTNVSKRSPKILCATPRSIHVIWNQPHQ
jgi:hypothetical protein